MDGGRGPVGPGVAVSGRGRSRRLAVVGAAAAVVLSACGNAPGTGAPTPVEQAAPAWPDPELTVVTAPQGMGTPMTEWERVDAATIAEESGEDLDRVLARLEHQDDFGSFVEQVAQRFPESYSTAAFAFSEEGPAWVAFTGEVPAEVVPLAEALPIPVELRGGAALTEREHEAVMPPAGEAFAADVQPVDGWSAGLDAPTAHLSFSYVPGGAKEPDEATTSAIVAAARAAVGRDVPFTVEYAPDARDPSETQPATWFLPAGFVVDPGATQVEVLVGEQGCTSGEGAEGNTAEPVVEVTATEVYIAVATFIRRGPQNCPGHPLAPVVVDLGEPVGDRVLVDVHGSIDDEHAPPESTWGDITVPPAAPTQE